MIWVRACPEDVNPGRMVPAFAGTPPNSRSAVAPAQQAEPQGIEMAPATLAYGAYRGRTLICRTPPSPVGAAGAARVELSLNGEAGDAMSDGSLIRFTYSED